MSITNIGTLKITSDENGSLKKAYTFCHRMARKHYENFPVASLFVPKSLRTPIAVIYAFARTADDISDEGVLSSSERLTKLNGYRQQIQADQPKELLLIALLQIIKEYQLPKKLLLDLLSAFEQDVTQKIYADFGELITYCRRSAQPIGRLLLHLTRTNTKQNFYYSDCICTALQLINFLQDLASDLLLRKRCYLPLNEIQAAGYSVEALQTLAEQKQAESPLILKDLIEKQLEKIGQLLHQGAPLLTQFKGRLGFELRLTVLAAYTMLNKLRQRACIFERPEMRALDWSRLIFQNCKQPRKTF